MTIDPAKIEERMEVRGSDGGHVGTVEKVEGDRIRLARTDEAAGGEHHYLHLDMVEAVADGAVRLTRTAAQARQEWGVKSVGGSLAERSEDVRGAEPGSSRAGP